MINDETGRGYKIQLLFSLLNLNLSCNRFPSVRLLFGREQAIRNMQFPWTP
jgi:hypothetical protein